MPKRNYKKNNTKKIIYIAAGVVALAVLVFFAMQGGGDGNLDGTFAHGAEVITFDGENFTVTGDPEGHRHFPVGTGTFVVRGGNIEFTYEDGSVETRRFTRPNADTITIDGHRYPRR